MTSNALTKEKYFRALIICSLLILVISGCKKSSPPEPQKPSVSVTSSNMSNSLKNVISSRTSWDPILKNFYGKQMPNFLVNDIDGKTHNLSDYRGKNVLVVMWATWCVPCLQEVPHLNALREVMDSNSLAILAISSEPANIVRAAAKNKNMSYTVISYPRDLPEPFNNIRAIPTTFFIKPDGTLKLVTEGSLRLGDMKSIILAE